MPNMMMAGILFQANASVARQAEETYRSVLELGRSRE
jgi:flagellar basal body rod protein FlgC